MTALSLIPLVQFFFSFSVSIFVSISLSILLYKHQKHTEKIITLPVIINISAWAIAAFLDLGYTSSSISSWFIGAIQSGFIYWTGALYFAATTAVSMSIFFITLDRCLIFTPSLFMDGRLKNRLYLINITAVVGSFILMLAIFIIFEMPDYERTKCQTFSCVSDQHALTLNVARMFFGIINTTIATVFAILFYLYNKQRAARMQKIKPSSVQVFDGQQQQQGNKIAWIAVFTEICLNFLPNLISYIAQVCFDFVLSSDAGPIVSTFTQLESLLTTIFYLKLIWNRIVKQKVSDTKSNTYV